MERAGVDLHTYRELRYKANNPLDEHDVSLIIKGVLEGLQYLHDEKRIIHRDIKPGNILMSNDGKMDNCKIIDFGLAVDELSWDADMSGTPAYWPPMVAKKHEFNQKMDIWAVGITVFELLVRRHPFLTPEHRDKKDILEAIKNFTKIDFSKTGLSETAQDFISQLCDPRLSQRLDSADALRHPFIKKKQCDHTHLTKVEKTTKMFEEYEAEHKLRKMQRLCFFIGLCKNHHFEKVLKRKRPDLIHKTFKQFCISKEYDHNIYRFTQNPKLGIVTEQEYKNLIKINLTQKMIAIRDERMKDPEWQKKQNRILIAQTRKEYN